jgi:phospholipase/lecithinase/hemolysin
MKTRNACRLLVAALFAYASAAHSYSELFVFGDSLSDTGNVALAIGGGVPQAVTGNSYIPSAPYASGQFTNGNVWVHTFASALGLSPLPSLAGGGIYAFGGAQTSFIDPASPVPSLSLQTNMFLSDLEGAPAPSDALYVIAGGGNNARNALVAMAGGADPLATIGATAFQYAADIGAMVDTLQAAGAKDIVVWNTPNVGLAPAVNSFVGTLLADAMNSALGAQLSGEVGVRLFDVFGLVSGIAANPALYGLSNVTDACGGLPSCDGYLFYDGIHPTAAGHAILGNAMVAAIPEPETYAMLLAGLGLLGFMARRRQRKAGES